MTEIIMEGKITFLLKNIVSDVAKLGSCLKSNYGALLVKDNKIISIGFTTTPKLLKDLVKIRISPLYLDDIIRKKFLEIELKGDNWRIKVIAGSNKIEKEGNIQELPCNKYFCPRINNKTNIYFNCPSIHAEQMAISIALRKGLDIRNSKMYIAKVKNKEFVLSGDKASCIECSYLLYKYNIEAIWLSERGIIKKSKRDYLKDISEKFPNYFNNNRILIEKYLSDLVKNINPSYFWILNELKDKIKIYNQIANS